MATRALIYANGKSVYTHFDGYPKHHMPILTNLYNTPEAVDKLMSHGGYRELKDDLVAQFESLNMYDDMEVKQYASENTFLTSKDAKYMDFVYVYDNTTRTWAYYNMDVILQCNSVGL